MFEIEEPPLSWMNDPPVLLSREILMAAPVDEVFRVLAEFDGWDRWFTHMTSCEMERGPAGPDATRVVKVGQAKVREHVVRWEPGSRMSFFVTASSLPGLKAMGEDWRLSATPEGGARLTVNIGAVGAGPLRYLPGLVRMVVGRSTAGAAGIAAFVDGKAS